MFAKSEVTVKCDTLQPIALVLRCAMLGKTRVSHARETRDKIRLKSLPCNG
jgi:hypothetical protein